MSQMKEVWELGTLTHPPVNWITGVEIFGRKFEIFLKFIDRALLFSVISGHEGFLRQAYNRQ